MLKTALIPMASLETSLEANYDRQADRQADGQKEQLIGALAIALPKNTRLGWALTSSNQFLKTKH